MKRCAERVIKSPILVFIMIFVVVAGCQKNKIDERKHEVENTDTKKSKWLSVIKYYKETAVDTIRKGETKSAGVVVFKNSSAADHEMSATFNFSGISATDVKYLQFIQKRIDIPGVIQLNPYIEPVNNSVFIKFLVPANDSVVFKLGYMLKESTSTKSGKLVSLAVTRINTDETGVTVPVNGALPPTVALNYFSELKTSLSTYSDVACGSNYAFAIKSDGTLWTCGYATPFAPGTGYPFMQQPDQLGFDSDWEQVACGSDHNFFIKKDGSLWGSGFNMDAGIGNGTTGNVNPFFPEKVGSANNWASVTCGFHQVLGIRSDNSLWAWGWNAGGILGTGSGALTILVPTLVGADKNCAQVSFGDRHAIAIKTDGSLWGWGENTWGQIGDGTKNDLPTPTRIGTETDWKLVKASGSFNMALKTDGTLWAWGNNSSGELGIGTTVTQFRPSQIGTDKNWMSIDCNQDKGKGFAMAIKTDGALWAWGANEYGQLGDGTTNNRLLPIQVGSDTDWMKVVCGDNFVYAIKKDGTLWSWGSNESGQLGYGDLSGSYIPKKVK